MNGTILIYIVTFFSILLINKKARSTIFDAFFFVVAPYVVIIFVNNLFMTKLGFYRIPDRIINLHLSSMMVFYVGTWGGQLLGKRITVSSQFRQRSLTDYSLRTILSITFLCEVMIAFDDLLRLRRHGLVNFINGGEVFGSSSIAAHLSRLLVPLIIILFDYFCETKLKRVLPFILIGLILLFSTFIKYHIISAILAIFIYIAIKRPYLIKWLSLAVLVIIVTLFSVNYMITFRANHVSISQDFYYLHFWQYIAGGTINIDNALSMFKGSYAGDLSISKWIFEMITSFPSMLSNRLLGIKFSEYVFSELLPFFNIGGKSISNVVSILGASYIQSDYFGLLAFSILSGILVQFIYVKAKSTKSISTLVFTSIFLSYCMLSFFSSFFELPGPWETMFWSITILPVLSVDMRHGKLIIKKSHWSIRSTRA